MSNENRRSSATEGSDPGRENYEDIREALGVLRDRGSQAAAEMLQALGGDGPRGPATVEAIDIDATLEERESSYGTFGDFSDKARFSQHIKEQIEDSFGWREFASATEREAMHMIVHKISRLVYGNPSHTDSWRDVAGYAMLVVKELEEQKGRPI